MCLHALQAMHDFYAHCHALCLNLVLVEVVKSVPEADYRTFFCTSVEHVYICVWLCCSYQVDCCSERAGSGEAEGTTKTTDVRWACIYVACRNLRDRLPAVLMPLQEMSLENSGERKVEANALLAQIDL